MDSGKKSYFYLYILSLFNDAFKYNGYNASNNTNDYEERVWAKAVMAQLNILARNLPGVTEEKHQTGNENTPSPSGDCKPDVLSLRPRRVVWHHHFIHNTLRPPCKPYESQHKDNSRN